MTENQQPRPGTWPTEPVDLDADTAERQAEQEHGAQYTRLQAERAWNQLVLDNIRIHLDRQPSPAAVQAAATHWKTAITQLADELITTRRNAR